jgi:hypothetical protein
MKFVSLRTKRAHKKGKVNKPTRATHEPFANASAAPHEIHTYEELRQKIHNDLRLQHPEWIQPDGESPICDSYEARLMEELNNFTRKDSAHSIVDPHRLLEQRAH